MKGVGLHGIINGEMNRINLFYNEKIRLSNMASNFRRLLDIKRHLMKTVTKLGFYI